MTFPQVPISEVCEKIVVGHVGPSSSHRCEGGLPFLMGKNVGEGFLKLDSLERVSPEFHHAQKKSQLSPGDVVVVRIGQSGLAAKVPPELGEANCAGLVVIKGPRAVTADYLVRYLNSAAGRRQSLKQTKGSTRQTLNTKSVAETTIPLPPLPEQKRIAKILDAADALRAKRRESLAQLDTLLQSTFLDMFGDPVTNPMGWKIVFLGQVSNRVTKGESPKWQGFEYQDDGVLFVTSENVRQGAIDISKPKFISLEFNNKLSRSELRKDDLLINLVGASIGRSCLFPGHDRPANVNQAVGVVTLSSKVEPTFLVTLLTTERGQGLLLGNRVEAARANISLKNIRELRIPLPSLDLQRRFAAIVDSVEKQKTRLRVHLAELDTLFASLQHRAFNGEL